MMKEDRKPILDRPGGGKQGESRGVSTCYIPRRYVLILLMFFGYFVSFCSRTSFNIALVAMVNFTDINSHYNNTSQDCPLPEHSVNKSTPKSSTEGSFDWGADLQGLLLGCFYYGYPILQLPAGYLADRFGGKYIFGFCCLTTGMLSLIMPTLAKLSPYAFLAARILQGLSQGPLNPSALALICRWIPPSDRTLMTFFAFAGMGIGTVTSLIVAGYMCDSDFLGGWPSVFYVFGASAVLWTAFWVPLAYNSPSQHPRITAAEKQYLEKETSIGNTKCPRPPWSELLTSRPVWGIFVLRCLDGFCFYIISSCVPLYLKQVLHFDTSQDGLMSALPFIPQVPLSLMLGVVVDWLVRKKVTRKVNLRRGAVIIGEFLPGMCLLLIAFLGCNASAVMMLLIANQSLGVFYMAGPTMSMFDIAPLYAGTIMGLVNGISNTSGFIAPQVAAAITGNSPNQKEWRTVFYIGAGLATTGTLIYCLLVSGDEQQWAKPNTEQTQITQKEKKRET